MLGRPILYCLLPLISSSLAVSQEAAEARAQALADRARAEGFRIAADLVPLLDHQNWSVRWHATRGIGLAGADWLDERLALLLDDQRVAPMAAYAIGQLTGQVGSWPPLDRGDDLVAAAKRWWTHQKERGEGWVTHDVALSPDLTTTVFGQTHAERGTAWLVVRDTAKDIERERLRWSGPARAIAFSGDSRTFAVSDDGGAVHIFLTSPISLVRRIPAHQDWILSIALSANGTLVASSAKGSTILRSVESGMTLWERSGAEMAALDFVPGSRNVVGGDTSGELLIVTPDGRANIVGTGLTRVADLECAPNGDSVATLHRSGELVLWDLKACRRIWQQSAHEPRPHALIIDGERSVVTAGSDRRVRVWSIIDGTLLADLECDRNLIALRRNGDEIVGAHIDGSTWRRALEVLRR